ncbi:class I SAM-dependent methyltransferase [Allostreptomyces psammosilenae]|uniref:Methyltransferase domain-containing protein n=1 Tax=Allostreptomyces psammosilenae TaxID=1892865 RepID=A0A853A0D5_9ACTN|nr:class I SAM-dependent methyltransferase [Allostreptomyces psammosilenae]NYI06394.1 hypothetical protein [Allostreptomyces psammosilenae]
METRDSAASSNAPAPAAPPRAVTLAPAATTVPDTSALPQSGVSQPTGGHGYGVTAEFYDLFHSRAYTDRARRYLAHAASGARRGILEVGAGTGLVTVVLGGAAAVPVHAVEPALPMRTVLLSRLATADPGLRERVVVHATTLQVAGLEAVADLAVCVNVAACLPPVQRRALWRAVAAGLLPGGWLLVDPFPRRPEVEVVRTLPAVRLGSDVYTCRTRTTPGPGDRMDMEFTYRVVRAGARLREERESFPMWSLGREQLLAELAEAGLYGEDGCGAAGPLRPADPGARGAGFGRGPLAVHRCTAAAAPTAGTTGAPHTTDTIGGAATA